jgi:hypothetical protein
MFDGHPFPEGLHMEEEGLRSALAVGGEGSLVGKELLSPEGNPRQSDYYLIYRLHNHIF